VFIPQEVSQHEALEIIAKYSPHGLFYVVEPDGIYTGIDNSTGDSWTENFPTLDKCLGWLNGEFEMEEE